MTKGTVKIVVALIGGVALIISAAMGFLSESSVSGDPETVAVSETVVYGGRVRNESNGQFLGGVEVSIDARVPKVAYTDSQGIYSVSVRRQDLSRDVKLYFRASGFEPHERSISPTDESIEDVRLRPVSRSSSGPKNSVVPSVATSAARPPGATMTTAEVAALVNEGPRNTASRAVLFVDSTGRVDAGVTSRVATALGATDSLFTPAFSQHHFRAVQAGQLDSLQGLRLEHIGAIALGLISTRTESKNVNGAEFTEARAEIGVRLIHPSRGFAAQFIAIEDSGTGFTPKSATQAAIEKALTRAIGELRAAL